MNLKELKADLVREESAIGQISPIPSFEFCSSVLKGGNAHLKKNYSLRL